jgi:hypothetical protein
LAPPSPSKHQRSRIHSPPALHLTSARKRKEKTDVSAFLLAQKNARRTKKEHTLVRIPPLHSKRTNHSPAHCRRRLNRAVGSGSGTSPGPIAHAPCPMPRSPTPFPPPLSCGRIWIVLCAYKQTNVQLNFIHYCVRSTLHRTYGTLPLRRRAGPARGSRATTVCMSGTYEYLPDTTLTKPTLPNHESRRASRRHWDLMARSIPCSEAICLRGGPACLRLTD